MRQQEMVSVQRELDAAKHEVRDIQGNLALVNDSKEKTQKELDKMLEQLGNARNELKAEREERMCKMAGVRERLVDLGTKRVERLFSIPFALLTWEIIQLRTTTNIFSISEAFLRCFPSLAERNAPRSWMGG